MKDVRVAGTVIRSVRPIDIFTVGERRPLNPETVEALAFSIRSLGLQHPLTLRFAERIEDPEEGEVFGAYVLVAGAHRLAAIRAIGLENVPCLITEWTETEARRWEISENLHRADLTTLQRNEQVAEWIALTDRAVEVSAQVGQKPRAGRPEGGVSAAARELKLERKAVDRAIRIAGITPEAKEAARTAGIENNQSALLKVAQAQPERQIEAVGAIVRSRSASRANTPEPPSEELFQAWLEKGRSWFKSGPPDWQERARLLGEQLERKHAERLWQSPEYRAYMNEFWETLFSGDQHEAQS